MFVLRILRRSRAAAKDSAAIHQIFLSVLVSLNIYAWKLFGCPGFSDCYLCRTFTPDYIYMSPAVEFPEADFNRLIDLNNFTFLMNNLVCNNTDLSLLVLIHSDPRNFEKRCTIRDTWGSLKSDKFKLLFLVGIPNNTVLQNQLIEENSANSDLVQGNFVDTYRNLTYKHVMAFKWIKYFCPNAKYLLKSDDDVFVNMPGLLHYVDRDLTSLPETQLMRCRPLYEERAQRTSRSKWKVSSSEYRFRRYPPYCQGFAILYSLDVVASLYSRAQRARYFWIDDVFVTGLLVVGTNFTPSSFDHLILKYSDLNRFLSNESKNFSYLLGPWNLRGADIRKLWEKLVRTVSEDNFAS